MLTDEQRKEVGAAAQATQERMKKMLEEAKAKFQNLESAKEKHSS
jgi:hypothetical protein